MKLSEMALVGGIALSSASGIQAKECQPGTPGYQAFPAASWLPTLAETCAVDRSTSAPLSTSLAYTKANVAGRDTGTLKAGETAQVVAAVHALALSQLDKVIEEEGSGVIERNIPVINISGSIQGTASPDVNLVAGSLKAQNGRSPSHALYRSTPENMLTAHRRCIELLSAIPATLSRGSQNVQVTTDGLECKPLVMTLSEDKWGVKITKLRNALIDRNTLLSTDEAEILAVKMANGKAPIPQTITPEMRTIIAELKAELESMRVVPVNGEMKVTVKVNTTEVDVTNTAILGGTLGVLLLLALRRRNGSSPTERSGPKLAHR